MNKEKEQLQYKFFSVSHHAWEAMYDAIKQAEKSIYWETYILIDDKIGMKFVEMLEKKAKQNLEVKLVIDGFGSYHFSHKSINRLKKAGVDIVIYNKITLSKFIRFWRALWERTHRKLLIVDNEMGFIGGINVRDFMADWLDLQLMVKGKSVRFLTRAFAKSYIRAGGKKKKVKKLLHPKIEKSKKIKFLFQYPHSKRSKVHARYLRAINKAKKYLKLAVPYYLPNKKIVKAIARARKRGVKIDLILPLRTDLKIIQWAARKYYNLMHRLGVRLHFTKKMMHGKGFVVDGREGMVGSSNIDQGSFYRNLEANAYFTDKKMIGDLEKIFEQWEEFAEPFEEGKWDNKSLTERLKSAFVEILKPWL